MFAINLSVHKYLYLILYTCMFACQYDMPITVKFYSQYNRYRVNPGPRQMNTEDLQASSGGNTFSESFKMAVYYDDSVNTG